MPHPNLVLHTAHTHLHTHTHTARTKHLIVQFSIIWQSCPDQEIDFREQQCIQYNNQSFRGKTYSWEAYIKGASLILYSTQRFCLILSNTICCESFTDDAECELNCKPIGLNYFATLNNTVIDGTTCYLPVDLTRRNISGRAMCVDGICKVTERGDVEISEITKKCTWASHLIVVRQHNTVGESKRVRPATFLIFFFFLVLVYLILSSATDKH